MIKEHVPTSANEVKKLLIGRVTALLDNPMLLPQGWECDSFSKLLKYTTVTNLIESWISDRLNARAHSTLRARYQIALPRRMDDLYYLVMDKKETADWLNAVASEGDYDDAKEAYGAVIDSILEDLEYEQRLEIDLIKDNLRTRFFSECDVFEVHFNKKLGLYVVEYYGDYRVLAWEKLHFGAKKKKGD